MIECCLKNRDLNDYIVILPYEINNKFLFDVYKYTENNTEKFGYLNIGLSDFGAPIEFGVEELDKLYKDFEILEENLDEIIKIVPLPEKVGCFDGILFVGYRTNIGFDNYVELGTGGYKNFDKEDMLYLTGLIKAKILEAKEKGENLIFSGD